MADRDWPPNQRLAPLTSELTDLSKTWPVDEIPFTTMAWCPCAPPRRPWYRRLIDRFTR